MIQSIQFRQESFHLKPEWIELPWDSNEKNIVQKLYDCGFKIGGLQNRMDAAGLQKGMLLDDEVDFFLERLEDCQVNLDSWYRDFLSLSPRPLFWVDDEWSRTQPGIQATNRSGPEVVSIPNHIVFPSLRSATATITYWGLKIAIAITARQLRNQPGKQPSRSAVLSHEQSGSGRSPPPNETGKQIPQAALDSDCTSRQFYHRSLPSRSLAPGHASKPESRTSTATPSNDPITLSTYIVRAMPFCLSKEQGLLGAQQALFPLRIALFILRLNPGPELRMCQNFYVALNEQKGLRYAKEIGKMDGGHGTRGNSNNTA